MKNELHVQASLWHDRAVLFMEGEAPDQANGGMAVEALYQAALGRGLRLTTDLDHLDPRPVPAWRLGIDEDRLVTLRWPHHRPLIDHIPLDLPDPWLPTAVEDGLVLLFVGYGLGMHEHAHDGESHPLQQLEQVAYAGALASGAVPVTAAPPSPTRDERRRDKTTIGTVDRIIIADRRRVPAATG